MAENKYIPHKQLTLILFIKTTVGVNKESSSFSPSPAHAVLISTVTKCTISLTQNREGGKCSMTEEHGGKHKPALTPIS